MYLSLRDKMLVKFQLLQCTAAFAFASFGNGTRLNKDFGQRTFHLKKNRVFLTSEQCLEEYTYD